VFNTQQLDFYPYCRSRKERKGTYCTWIHSIDT